MPDKSQRSLNEIERYIIGKILTGVHVLELTGELNDEMFLNKAHSSIFFHALELSEEGISITFLTVAGRIGDLIGDEDTATYLSACMHLANKTTDMKLADAVLMIREAYIRRRTIESLETAQKLLSQNKTNQEVITGLEIDLVELNQFQHSAKQDDLASAARKNIEEVNDAMAGKGAKEIPWVHNGLKIVADGDLQYGNYHAIMLDSGGGKTSLMLQQIRHTAELGIPVLFISYEQTVDRCLRQMSAQRLGIQSNDMRRGKISEQEFERFMNDQNALKDLPIQIVKAAGWGAKQIVSAMRKFKRTMGEGLVIIDHHKKIKLERGENLATTMSNAISLIGDGLIETGHAGILLAQRRSSAWMKRDDPSPAADDVFAGDAIIESLDVFIGMWRPEQVYKNKLPHAYNGRTKDGELNQKQKFEDIIAREQGKAKLLPLKNREGNLRLRAELDWEAEYTRFSDPKKEAVVMTGEPIPDLF